MVQGGFLHRRCRLALAVKGCDWERVEWFLFVLEISIGGSWVLKLIDGLVGILARTSFG